MNCSFFPLPRGFPYAIQRLGHASPALRPVRALLTRVPLGSQPWLQLRPRSPGFVRRLRSLCESREISGPTIGLWVAWSVAGR